MQNDKKENPEALATFADSARNDGKRSKDRPDQATEATKAIPVDPGAKDEAATAVLQGGIKGRPEEAQEKIDRLPDRTKPRS